MIEKIRDRLNDFKKQYQEQQANLQALSGAIQALEILLKEEREEEKEHNDGE